MSVPLFSTSKYIQGLIDGTPMPPGIPGPLTAWITPPVAEQISAPRAYVWGGKVNSGRQTAPRGMGFRKRPWVIDVYLSYMDSPDDALANEPFAQVIDTVTEVFETAVMPVFIGPLGNVVEESAAADATYTQIQAIGESWSLSYAPERTTLSMRQLWYTALISLDVLEVIQR